MTLSAASPSSYLDYLPATMQEDPMQEDPFLGEFLLAFEAILSGVSVKDGTTPEGFEQKLANIHTYFSPPSTPTNFLPWLAGWVALSLRDDWDDPVKRDFIQQIIPLYQKRGTKEALTQMLKIYLQKQTTTAQLEYVKIYEFDHIPHYFQVQLRLDSQDLTEYRRKETVARAIIEQEKPAHTIYALQILMPTMRLVSAEKLAQENVSSNNIPKQRLRLFASSESSEYKKHRNRTVLGSTSTPPSF